MPPQYIPQTDPYSIPKGFQLTQTPQGGTAYRDPQGNFYIRDVGGFKLTTQLPGSTGGQVQVGPQLQPGTQTGIQTYQDPNLLAQQQQQQQLQGQLGGLGLPSSLANFPDIQNILSLLTPKQNPQQEQFIQQQQSSLDRLTKLYEQLQTTSSSDVTELRKAIASQQQSLRDLTPAKYLESQPGLKGIGISQGFLERQVALQREPIARTLSDLLTSESILGQDEERRRRALQDQIDVTKTEFGLRGELQKLRPQPFQFPEATQNKILEKFLGLEPKPTSLQEFQYSEQNPKYAEFLQTGKKDIEQQQFSNQLRIQQLQIAAQNAQNAADRTDILNQVRLLQLQQQTQTTPGQVVNAATGFPAKLTEEQIQNFSNYGIYINDYIPKAKELLGQVKTGAVIGRLIKGAQTLPLVQNLLSRPQNELLATIANMNNQLVYMLSGKQINETEYKRLLDQMPRMELTNSNNNIRIGRFEKIMNEIRSGKLKLMGLKIATGDEQLQTLQGFNTPLSSGSQAILNKYGIK